jgi:hypothetical protein
MNLNRSRTELGRRATRCAWSGLLVTSLVLISGCGRASPAVNQPKYGSEEFGLTLEELTVRVEQTEAAIGRCMSKAGFQYLPLDFATVKKAMQSDKTAPGLSGEQYVKQFGFGVTTQLDKPIVNFGAGPQNQEILVRLPATDQVSYRRTLWGEKAEWTLARALEQEDLFETQGCTRAAVQQYFDATELSGSYVNPGDKLIESDKRMIEALKKWADCMRRAGFNYGRPDEIADDLHERLVAITRRQDPKALSVPAQRALNALQGEELAIAGAEAACFDDNVAEVEARIESEIYGARQS